MVVFKYSEEGNFHAVSILKNPKDKEQWLLCLDYEPIRSYKRLQDAKASATKKKTAMLKRGGVLRD